MRQGRLTYRPHMRYIARFLKLHGVTEVRIDYAGHWDHGGIDLVTYLDARRREVEPCLSSYRKRQLEECFLTLLEQQDPHWPKDNGAFGQFIWDVAHDALRHEHYRRYVDYHTTSAVYSQPFSAN